MLDAFEEQSSWSGVSKEESRGRLNQFINVMHIFGALVLF